MFFSIPGLCLIINKERKKKQLIWVPLKNIHEEYLYWVFILRKELDGESWTVNKL